MFRLDGQKVLAEIEDVQIEITNFKYVNIITDKYNFINKGASINEYLTINGALLTNEINKELHNIVIFHSVNPMPHVGQVLTTRTELVDDSYTVMCIRSSHFIIFNNLIIVSHMHVDIAVFILLHEDNCYKYYNFIPNEDDRNNTAYHSSSAQTVIDRIKKYNYDYEILSNRFATTKSAAQRT